MEVEGVGAGFMVDEDPIVRYAGNMTFAFASEIAGKGMVFKEFGGWGVGCQFIDYFGERCKIPMSPMQKFYATFEL